MKTGDKINIPFNKWHTIRVNGEVSTFEQISHNVYRLTFIIVSRVIFIFLQLSLQDLVPSSHQHVNFLSKEPNLACALLVMYL